MSIQSTKKQHGSLLFLTFWLIIAIGTTLACRIGREQTSSVIEEDCHEQTEPSQKDVTYALEFTGNIFEGDAWQRSYFVETSRVGITWLDNQESGLAYMEYLIFSCGYSQAGVDDYFSEYNFKEIIFRDYQDLERKATCTTDDGNLTLYEFTAQSQDTEYLIRYWIKLDSPTRILNLLLAYPPNSERLLDEYGAKVFPELTAC